MTEIAAVAFNLHKIEMSRFQFDSAAGNVRGVRSFLFTI